ncbi:tumor necrosis factor receptor superfamily member 12A [Gastrophryne carolinensis]
MSAIHFLKTLVLLFLVQVSRQEASAPTCEKGSQWSNDLGKCKDCSLCETSSKDDFCQTCDIPGPGDFPLIWVAGGAGLAAFLLTCFIGLTIYMTRCRPKNKFTTPIEETGAHSAEELLIH